MFSIRAPTDPTLPAVSPAVEPASLIPTATPQISQILTPCSTADLREKHISRQESVSHKMTQIAEQLSGNSSKANDISDYIYELKGERHLTPWKKVKKFQLVNLLEAAIPLTELSVKDPTDIALVEHYHHIRERCKGTSFQKAYPFHHVEKNELDRFVGTIPNVHNCVALNNGQYINASVVDGVVPIIMTQAPIPPSQVHPGTFADFWQMVWERGCRDIVMLNRHPDEEYWPAEVNHPVVFGNIEVTKHNEIIPHPGTIHRTYSIRNRETGGTRIISHKQMTDWGDRKVPTMERFLQFLLYCRDNQSTESKDPFVVHCNYGAGRSGTFVLAYNILSLIWKLPPDSLDSQHMLNFPSWLLWLRSCRANAVSEDIQFILIYQIVSHVIKQIDEAENC